MRIDSNQGQPVSEGDQPATNSRTARASRSAANRGLGMNLRVNEDQAQLSGTRVLVQALAAEAAQLPEVRQENVRQEKVSALRQAVRSGDYCPDPEQVAGALFSQLGASSPDAVAETDWRASQEWATAM
jgi:flagellar biosynthesis anti-sigma factor FlgM